MTTILLAGLATLDFVFDVDEMPRRPEKYRARDAQMHGGGGAANAAVAIARLGGRPLFAARLGDDAFADMIVAGLRAEGAAPGMKDAVPDLMRRVAGCRSSFSSVFVDLAGERQIVNFRDDSMPADARWLAESLPVDFEAALSDTRWPDGALAVMQAARKAGRPGVIDAEAPVRIALLALQAASHIAFSRQGLRGFSGDDDLENGLRAAARETGAWVCVTDGANGVTYLEDGKMNHIKTFVIDAVETLGAGDIWHGAFALALGEGRAEPNAIRFANAVAAIKCARRGGRAGYPARAEVEEFMKEKQ